MSDNFPSPIFPDMIPTKEQFLASIAKTEKLVPAPRSLARAMRLLRDPQANLDDIADLISRDSALAVDVLRCANSAFYGNAERVAAVGPAVQIIGFRETIRLLNLVAAHQTTHRNLGSYGIAAEDFWAESLFSGLYLEGLARHTQAFDPGEAYTAGLLRFLGRLAINQAVDDLGGGLFWDGRTSLAEWERENVGITQAAAGAQLLRKWEFPEAVVQAVGTQDDAAVDAGAAPLVQAAHFAAQVLPSGLDRAFIESLEQHVLEFPPDHPFVATHGLSAEDATAVRVEAQAALLAIRDQLYN